MPITNDFTIQLIFPAFPETKVIVATGRIPDEIPTNLQEQFLMQDAKAAAIQAINCKEILGTPQESLRDAPQLVANYGGNLEDWVRLVPKPQ